MPLRIFPETISGQRGYTLQCTAWTNNLDTDQQRTLFLLLSWPTTSVSGKWGDFVNWRTWSSWSLYYKVKQIKTTLNKYFHLPLKPTYSIYNTYISAHIQCREPKKVSNRFHLLKKTTGLCPSRCYYSMVYTGTGFSTGTMLPSTRRPSPRIGSPL